MSESNGTVEELSEQALGWQVELLQERLAELEMALFNDGWARLGQQFEQEFSREAIDQIAYLARLYYLKNPLLRRSVNVQAFYVFGQGVTITHEDEQARGVIDAFLDDAGNQAELTRNQAMLAKERLLQLTGNVFFVLFANGKTGRVQVRSIPLREVKEIVCDPDDARRPWYYKRVWNKATMQTDGSIQRETATAWYPDWRYTPRGQEKLKRIAGAPVRWESPVYHMRAGGLDDMQFGVPEVYAQIDWAQAYKEFLEDWATLTRAYSRFAHKLSTTGGPRGVAAAKAKLGTTYAAGGSGAETNPPPVVGSTFIAGQGVDLQTMRIGGANVSAEDGRRLLLMVAAGAGLPETFYGDASVGTVATAKSLDRPTELQMRSRQTLWSDVFRDLITYVLRVAVEAKKLPGSVTAEDDGTPRVTLAGDVAADPLIQFPPLLEHDIEQQIRAIIGAATLDGKAPAGTMDSETLVRLLLTALGVEDVQKVLDALDEEQTDGETEGQRGRGAEGQADGGTEDQAQQEESLMVEAVRELRDAVRRIVESEL